MNRNRFLDCISYLIALSGIILLILLALGGVFFSFMFCVFSDIVRYAGNGCLKIIFIAVYLTAVAAAIIIYKKTEKRSLFFIMTIALCAAVLANAVAYNSARIYFSNYSRSKWDNNEYLRYCMIDDLERKYKIVGMTKDEVTDLLGKPDHFEYREDKYEYFAGSYWIDVQVYTIWFEDDIAVRTYVIRT